MIYKYIKKMSFKCFLSILLLLSIFFSYASVSLATDDSLYVWSSSGNTLNILDDNIRPSNVNTETNNTNATTNTNANSHTTTTTSNTSNSANTTSSAISTSADENSLLTNAGNEVVDDNSLNLESASAILIEQSSGRVLYAHNIHEQLRPASVTKVMSILLIMEAIDSGKISLTDTVPCSENAASMGGSQIWLDTTETLTVDEMLKAICVNSANDYSVQKEQENIFVKTVFLLFSKSFFGFYS